MKKLMIALAVVCAAAVTQAATFAWGTSGKAFSIDATTVTAGLAAGHYGVGSNNNSTMYNQISSFTATWAYEITFPSGTDSDVISGSLVASDFSSRYVSVSDLSSDLVVQTDPVTQVGYSIVFTGTLKDGKGNNWTLTSDAVTGTWDVPSIGDLNFKTAGPSGWTVAGGSAVPEPTSGLLLLLGVAGLALRRKHA